MNLEQQVKHLDKHYRDGNPIVSDKKFDILEKKLYEMHPDSDYFTNRDALPLPSLEKDTIEDFIDDLPLDTMIMIEPKIDGCAVAIEYRNGRYYKAITRKGKDITDKIFKIETVPLFIPTKKTIQVRGELFCPLETGAVSQRKSAGYLRSASLTPDAGISFFAFQIINADTDHFDTIDNLKNLGFRTPIYSLSELRSLEAYRQMWLKDKIFSSYYPVDGIVVKIVSIQIQLDRPDYWQMAIKY